MRFLAVDDERLAREELKHLLQKTVPESEIIACASAKEALAMAQESLFDIAFLDIELGTYNGIWLAKQLKDLQPKLSIIFVTSYSEYAVEAFSIHATGYLLKPIQMEHIQREPRHAGSGPNQLHTSLLGRRALGKQRVRGSCWAPRESASGCAGLQTPARGHWEPGAFRAALSLGCQATAGGALL